MWSEGRYGKFRWAVKHYAEPSAEYGLNGSRISKLWIADSSGKWVYNYDRGADVDSDDPEVLALVHRLMEIYG